MMDREKFQHITFTIPMWGERSVFAYVTGDFAAHRVLYRHHESRTQFAVTHIPTGCAIYDEFTSLWGAVELVDMLSKLDLPTIHKTKTGKPRHDANWRRFNAIVTPVIQEVILTDAVKT